MILRTYEVFTEATEAEDKIVNFQDNGETFLIEVTSESDCALSILGNLQSVDNEGTALSVINMGTFEVSQTITSAGIYAMGIIGLDGVTVSLTSAPSTGITVYGKLV